MASFSWTEPIVAPPSTVWEVLADYPGYAAITMARRVEIEREGTPAPNGVGAIRKIVAVGPPVREEIVEFEPERKLVYKMLSGAPVKDHVGTVTLEPAPGGTRMHYEVNTFPAIPVIGHLAVRIVKFAVSGIVKGVVSESEKRAAAAR